MRNTIAFCYVYMPNYRDFFNEPYSVVICLNNPIRQFLNQLYDMRYDNIKLFTYQRYAIKIPSTYVRCTNKMTTNTLSVLYFMNMYLYMFEESAFKLELRSNKKNPGINQLEVKMFYSIPMLTTLLSHFRYSMSPMLERRITIF